MDSKQNAQEIWLPVIGRALVYLCYKNADIEGKTIAEKAQFVQAFGLDANDAAIILGSSAASVKESIRVAKKANPKKGGSKKNAASKKASKTR